MAINFLGGIYTPPDSQPLSPAVATRVQALPFGELSWENFERLCHRLALTFGGVEHAARYGRSGQAQEGIDIFARLEGGRYHCWQAKRRRSFSAANLRGAVDLFLNGQWARSSSALTIALQSNTADTKFQDEAEAQTLRLKELGIDLRVVGSDELSDELRSQPTLVDDFFGRAWVEAFLGAEAARSLGQRLDGVAFARVRAQLGRVYESHFNTIDPGTYPNVYESEAGPALSITERFLLPDVLVAERRLSTSGEGLDQTTTGREEAKFSGSPSARDSGKLAHDRRRVPFLEWARQGEKVVVLGDAGSGKSTLLRCLALDLLGSQRRFGELTERWGTKLPLLIPFARWSREVVKDGPLVGLKEIVRRCVQPLLTDDIVHLLDRAVDEKRVLLLVDGLDEWADEQAARTTLQLLLTFAGAHDLPVLMTARPRGFEKIGSVPAAWKSATLAPFSQDQQRMLAQRWFDPFESASGSDQFGSTNRATRFMSEIARDGALAALAEVPLLLVGLITLSLRGQTLPRSKVEAYQALVALLLEHHPKKRADAALDSGERFKHARDPEQRRAALACLAFTIRSEGGDAGFPWDDARRVIRHFLQSPRGFELSAERATLGATEILAVNSELQGLIVEKAPGEIGFAHASFEEFLAAEHLQRWPFDRARTFVAEHAGDPRWRNVIVMLLSNTARRDEFESLLAGIESRQRDPLATMHARNLLIEAAFSASNRAPAAALSIIESSYEEIESGDWLVPRRDALNSALGSLDDPNLGAMIARRLEGWSPSRSGWRSTSFEALATWEQAPDLLGVFWRSLHDEDRSAQWAAAKALGKVYAGDEQIAARLQEGLGITQRLSVAGSMLESLRVGWADLAGMDGLFEEAAVSLDPSLALAGIAQQAEQGDLRPAFRDNLHRWLHFSQEVDYHDQGIARDLLTRFWANDETLLASALRSVGNGSARDLWDPEDATFYLLACSPVDHRIRDWLMNEFKREYPLILAQHNSANLGKFADHDPVLRDAMLTHWLSDKNRKYHGNRLLLTVSTLADDRLKVALLEDLRSGSDFMLFWTARCLLEGWGVEDDDVAANLRAAVADDARGIHLLSLIPCILSDAAVSRARLLELGSREGVRQDLLANGLAEAGCDGSDAEAVALLLTPGKRSGAIFSGANSLFASFADHSDVRAQALINIDAVDPALTGLILGFQNDPVLRPKLLDAVAPLPVELRSVVAEAAIADPGSPPFSRILSWYDRESDPELKIRLSIGYHRNLAETEVDSRVPALVAEMKAVGPSHSIQRSAALVGLLAIDRLDAIRDELERGEPLQIALGERYKDTPSLHPFLCEHWGQLDKVFGTTLAERVDKFADGGGLLEVLSAAPWRSAAAQRAFLHAFEHSDEVPSAKALRAYAQLRPRSEILLSACLKRLQEKPALRNDVEHELDIVQILRDQFPAQESISDHFIDRLSQSRSVDDASLVALYCPERLRAFERRRTPIQIGVEDQRWTAALIIGTAVSSESDFLELLKHSFRRTSFMRWDYPEPVNAAISERLQRDDACAQALRGWIDPESALERFVNAARYLAIAGLLHDDARERVSNRLETLLVANPLPTGIYDGVAGRIRSASIALYYALQGDQAGQA